MLRNKMFPHDGQMLQRRCKITAGLLILKQWQKSRNVLISASHLCPIEAWRRLTQTSCPSSQKMFSRKLSLYLGETILKQIMTSLVLSQLRLLLELQTEAPHWEFTHYDLVVLGEDPGESFSLKSSDNLLSQQLLNLSCLSKEPAYPPADRCRWNALPDHRDRLLHTGGQSYIF